MKEWIKNSKLKRIKWYEYLLIANIVLFDIPYTIYYSINGNQVDKYGGYLIQLVIFLFLLWLSLRSKKS